MNDSTGHDRTLSPTQDLALAALVEGATVTDAAAAAGVTRQTVHRWVAEDHVFAAELNRARAELRDAYRRRLYAVADEAIGAVEGAIGSGDARVALTVLRDLGLLKPASIGATDPAELQADREADTALRQSIRRTQISLGA